MWFTALRGRSVAVLPGVTGIARVVPRGGRVSRRVGPGDVAVIDQLDVDRRTADALIAAEVVGVVNAAPSISGRFPNLGPELLVASGIPLIDDVGSDAVRGIRDGSKLRLHDGGVFVGEREVARGTEQTGESIADQLIEAKAGMSAQLEAFSANTIEFLRRERTLILDGVGVPELRTPMRDRQVLVVTAGGGVAGELRRLRRYIREYRPVLVGVEGGADALRAAGHRPDVVVADPAGIADATLRCGAEVVVPAQLDGHAPGLARVQDLGIGAVTFPASGIAEDLALLIADAHGADVVVTVGIQAGLREFLDRDRSGSNPCTFLTRLKLGGRLVDGAAVAALYRGRVTAGAMALLVFAVCAAMVVALVASGLGHAYIGVFENAWHTVVSWGERFV